MNASIPVFLSTCLLFYLSTGLLICLSTCLPVHLSTFLPVCQFARLPALPPVIFHQDSCLFVYLSTRNRLSVVVHLRTCISLFWDGVEYVFCWHMSAVLVLQVHVCALWSVLSIDVDSIYPLSVLFLVSLCVC
jgi:hypothetical protein